MLELKGREGDDEELRRRSVLEVLEGYKGHVALMSFDHWLLKDLKALELTLPRRPDSGWKWAPRRF